MQWVTEGPGSSSARDVELDDAVSITVRYEGAVGTLEECVPSFEVPVSVELSTEASALAEVALGNLTFKEGSPVWLDVHGHVVSVHALLEEAGASLAPSGKLTPHVSDAPGKSATLGPLPSDAEGKVDE